MGEAGAGRGTWIRTPRGRRGGLDGAGTCAVEARATDVGGGTNRECRGRAWEGKAREVRRTNTLVGSVNLQNKNQF